MTKVLVIGDGRMGTIVRELVEADESLELAGVIGIDNKDELADTTPAADVAIDFSHKSMLDLVEAYVNRTGAALVSGTTGYDEAEMGRIRALGEKAPVIHSANYSLGVAVLRRLAAEAAKALPGFDIEIVETHHNQKVDAPSGTAKLLLSAVNPEDAATWYMAAKACAASAPLEKSACMPCVAVRLPAPTRCTSSAKTKEVALTHRATSRRIFASGAVARRKSDEREPGSTASTS